MWRQTKKLPPALVGPTIPPQARYILDWYRDFSLGRSSEGPFFLELEAWARSRGITLKPWEAEAMLRIDAAGRRMAAKALNKALNSPSG